MNCHFYFLGEGTSVLSIILAPSISTIPGHVSSSGAVDQLLMHSTFFIFVCLFVLLFDYSLVIFACLFYFLSVVSFCFLVLESLYWIFFRKNPKLRGGDRGCERTLGKVNMIKIYSNLKIIFSDKICLKIKISTYYTIYVYLQCQCLL